jgi:DNA-binding transcriptional LysR family regulator
MTQQKGRPIDLYQLDVFLTVSSLGSMSVAADTLGISQSAVSQAIAQLEQSIGIVLIDRTRRPLSLTAAGLSVAQNGEPVLAQARRLKAQATEMSHTESSYLRIGLIDSFAHTIGPSLIKQLFERTSGLSVQIGMAVAQEEALLRREVDMIITTNALVDNAAFEHRLLYREGFIAISEKNETPEEQPSTLKSLSETKPFIRFSRSSTLAIRVERILRYNQLDLPRKLEVDYADTLTLLVAQGLGWAITTPTCLMQTGNRFVDSLELVPITVGNSTRSIYLVGRCGEFPSLSDQILDTVRKSVRRLLIEQAPVQQKLAASCIEVDD